MQMAILNIDATLTDFQANNRKSVHIAFLLHKT